MINGIFISWFCSMNVFWVFLFLSLSWLETLLNLWNHLFKLNMSKLKPIPPHHRALLILYFLLLLKIYHSPLQFGPELLIFNPSLSLSIPLLPFLPLSNQASSAFISVSQVSLVYFLPNSTTSMLVQVLNIFHVDYCSHLTDLSYSSLAFTFYPEKNIE